jgi:hypothetical protein
MTDLKRGEPRTKWTLKVQEDVDGELYIQLPDELMYQLKWKFEDNLHFEETDVCEDSFDSPGLVVRNLTAEKDDTRFEGTIY